MQLSHMLFSTKIRLFSLFVKQKKRFFTVKNKWKKKACTMLGTFQGRAGVIAVRFFSFNQLILACFSFQISYQYKKNHRNLNY